MRTLKFSWKLTSYLPQENAIGEKRRSYVSKVGLLWIITC